MIHSAGAKRAAPTAPNALAPLTRYSVSATPEVASAAVSVSVTGPVPAAAAVVAGAVASSLTVADFAASVLPALSSERYSTVCSPSAATRTGAL